jgi:hypothetical protein
VRPPARPGLATAFIAGLVLCAQFGGLTHAALERHARCEHGEFIELDDGDFLLPTAAPREAGVNAAPEDHLSSGHRHCLAQDEARAELAVRPALPQLLAVSSTLALAPEQRATHAGRDRYRLVPKQSPPA